VRFTSPGSIVHPGSVESLIQIRQNAFDETELSVSQRARYLDDPVLWAKERVGVHLWSKQREMLEAVRDNRRVAVHSCHNVGKTFTAALCTAWWLDTHPPGTAFVVTTAPTGPQVKALLWRRSEERRVGKDSWSQWWIGD